MKVVIVKAIQTCPAAPTQWDAWDAEGRKYYFRHRHGRGRAERLNTEEIDNDGVFAQFQGELQFSADPRVSLESFCQQAGIELAPDAVVNRSAYDEGDYSEPLIKPLTGFDIQLLRKYGL